MPKLSDEFQTRVQISQNEKQQGGEVIILFDRNDRRGELISHDASNVISRKIYYFDKNEVLTIKSKTKVFLNIT